MLINNHRLSIHNPGLGIKDLIAYREDVFDFLIVHNMDRKKAFEITEYVRKGKTKWQRPDWKKYKKEMTNAQVPNWFISSCEKIGYLCPRAHGISYMYMLMRLAWFKINYPKEFQMVKAKFYE